MKYILVAIISIAILYGIVGFVDIIVFFIERRKKKKDENVL